MPSSNQLIQLKYGLQTSYDGLEQKDLNTLYFCTDSQRLFVGETEYTRPVQHGGEVPEGYLPPNSFFVKETGTGRELHYSKDGASWDLVCKLPATISGGVFGNNTAKKLNFAETFYIPKITVDSNGFITAGEEIALQLPDAQEIAGVDISAETSGEGNAVTEITADGSIITVTKGETFATKTEFDPVKTLAEAAMPKTGGEFTGPVTVQAPSANMHPATKQYADEKLTEAKGYADSLLAANDAMLFKGTVGNGTSGATVTDFSSLTDYKVGWTYRVITAGTYANIKCEVGDLLIAVADYSESLKPADWTVAQTNIDGAVISDAGFTDGNIVVGSEGQKVKDSGIKAADLATKSELTGKVDTSTTIAITGGATAEATPLTNGTVSLNVTSVQGSSVSGAVAEATHATSADSATTATNATNATTAESAGKLSAAQNITLTGDATGSAAFDGSAAASIAVTVSHAASADTATNATNATTATNATNATNATKATQDASGNVISDTYATKTEVNDSKLKWGTF